MTWQETIYYLCFYLFGAITIGAGAVVALSHNIVRSGFALLATFFGVAGLYAMGQADFLASVQIIIYVGGILVLILFAVMLTRRISNVRVSNESVPGPFAGAVCALIYLMLVWGSLAGKWQTSPGAHSDTTSVIGKALMTDYLLAFEAISVLLLAALIGAAFLARKEVRE